MSGEDDEGFVIRIRGLPWSSTKEEILKFFSSCKIKGGVEGIHMTLSREGRPSGECYVELETDDDMQKGLDKHNEHMGHRYIEVFKSKRSEMEWVVKRSGAHQEDSLNDGCIRLRGLPFGCSKEEIAQFFSGLEIVPNGITLPTDYQGRSTGEAFVQFASRDIAENAMGKHKEKIGHRYIEIFKSSLQEVRAALGMGVSKMRQMGSARPSPYDRNDRFGGPAGRYGGGASRGGRNFRGMMNDDDFGNYGGGNFGAGNFGRGGMRGNAMNSFGNRNMGGGGGGGGMGNNRFMGNGGGGFSGNNRPFNNSGHFVHMRGLPFRAIEQDVFEFFRPINPINVHILYEDGGRPSGEADVEFAAHEDAVKAMSKDKSHMQHRYIELFLNSTPNPMGGGNANTGNGGAIGLGNAGNFANNMNSGMGGTGSGMGNAGGLGGGGMGNAGGNMGGGGGGGMGFGNNPMGNSFGGAAGRMGTGLNNLGMGNMNSGSGMGGGGGNNPGNNFYGTGGGGGGMGGMGNSGMGGMGNTGMGGGMGGNMGGGMGMGQVGMMGVPDFTNF